MGKTKNRLRPFNCGHRGFGAYCHRCAEADRLVALAEGKVKPSYPKSFDGWTKERFLTEAKRLRSALSNQS